MNYSFFNLANLFYAVSEKNKNEIAIRYKEKEINYDQLNKLSNQIANYFLAKGIKSYDVVGIFNTKEILGYASMLACLKIGSIYTNIDEENPIIRLEKILTRCEPKLLIIDCKPSIVISDVANKLNVELIDLSKNKFYETFDDKNLVISNNVVSSTPAYIMFTSGSTGNPKGVVISHSNILSFINWSVNRYEITSHDTFAQVSPMYFDNSVFDFYTALFSGASLVPVKKEIISNLPELISLIDITKCTIWFSVPTLLVYLQTMKAFNDKTFKSIRVFTFGGEGFPKAELKKLYDLYKKQAKIINVYGPTEGTCICTSYEISENDFKQMNILASLGKVNPNFEKIIVDKNMNEVKESEKGELCLIGPNVSLGYYNDTYNTSKNFVQNPKIKTHRDIIYKTGDIVYEKDGLLWFAGRSDNQIKHMGYRIELEEIEAAINALKYVNQSAVVYERIDENYGKIISYIATKVQITELEIKKEISKFLPNYMVPNIIIIKKDLPKNANGKIDKRNLTNK
jgi:D-alanine--poly(phosphoribitol) ligase subunit 1